MRLYYFTCPRCGGSISKGVLSEGLTITSMQFTCRDSECGWRTREAPQVEVVMMNQLIERHNIGRVIRVGNSSWRRK